MTTGQTKVSQRISGILDILKAIRAANPATLDKVAKARLPASQAVATARGTNERAVYNSTQEQLGLATISQFDTLALNWLSSGDPALQTLLEAHTSSHSPDADLAAIRDFFRGPERSYWWVNQRTTFDKERSGRYLWAPQHAQDGHVRQHHANVSLVEPGDIIFHYSQGFLRAVGQAMGDPREAPRPLDQPDAATDAEGRMVAVNYIDIPESISLARIPIEWRLVEHGPFTRKGTVKQGYLYPLSVEFVRQVLAKFNDLWLFPTDSTFQGRSLWVAQRNSDALEQTLRYAEVGARGELTVTSDHDAMRPADLVFLWQTGAHAGIYAIGEIVDHPQEMVPNNASVGGDVNLGSAKPQWHVKFQHTHIFPKPLLRAALESDLVLEKMEGLQTSQTTSLRITSEEWSKLRSLIDALLASRQIESPAQATTPTPYVEPSWFDILAAVKGAGLSIDARTLRRYHLSLKTRGFVILSGLSGIGKTWLAQAYAAAVGAVPELVAVAPNWTTNEDLLGYFNPLDNTYHDTAFSRFLRGVSTEYKLALAQRYQPKPYHLILDEMNLARVEYYFARFLSAMEVRARDGQAPIELGPSDTVILPPNLFFIGTVNIDETTHGFADKVYDRAQLIELQAPRVAIHEHFRHQEYSDALIDVWDAVHEVAPFGFRVLDEIAKYVDAAQGLGVTWEEALDEQLLQKVLPKLKGADLRVGAALERCMAVTVGRFSLTHAKAKRMKDDFDRYGSTTYF